MKHLIRGIISVEGQGPDSSRLRENFLALERSTYRFEVAEDGAIVEFVTDFFRQQHHLPADSTVRYHFQQQDQGAVVNRLDNLCLLSALTRGDYLNRISSLVADQRKRDCGILITDCGTVLKNGLTVGEGRDKKNYHGVDDAIRYFIEESEKLTQAPSGVRLSGDVIHDTEELEKEYLARKADPRANRSCPSGLLLIDDNTDGVKPGELWIHAAYTGEGKCLAGETRVFDHHTNRYQTVRQMFEEGTAPLVTALFQEGQEPRLIQAQSSPVMENGVKEVFDLQLASGRSIGATGNHKFFTPSGWVELRDLTPGSRVAIEPESPEPNLEIVGDIAWDTVESITFRGEEMTYDLSVPEHHSFVANGIITHNTLFAQNWAYNLAVYGGYDVMYVTLEVPYESVRRALASMHSFHEKFTYPPDDKTFPGMGLPPLSYRNIRDSKLTPEEEEHWLRTVLPDLEHGSNAADTPHGTIYVWRPKDEVTIQDIRFKAELQYRARPFDMLIIDHLGLVVSSSRSSREDVKVNDTIRGAKRLALNFNQGMGIPLLGLYQINREGKKAAEKSGGKYGLYHLSGGSEAERSADVVTTTYLDDALRKPNREGISGIQFNNLKCRDNPIIPQFTANLNFTCRRIWHMAGPDEEVEVNNIGETPLKMSQPKKYPKKAFKNETLPLDDFNL